MKLQLGLVASAVNAIYPVNGLNPNCPDNYCANNANSEPTIDSAENCPNLAASTLQTFTYSNGDVLIELRGPTNLADAADLVIAAPHGGDFRPDYISDRTWGKTDKDSYTMEISELLQEKFIENYCKVPFLVINHLHRSKLDANREIIEAAQGNATAMEAWTAFHTFINYAQGNLSSHFGTSTVKSSTGSSKTGVNALLFDMHGYAGYDWNSTDGSPLIQWGFRVSDDPSLEKCPLDSVSTGSIGSLTHARWMSGHSYECLVRGPGSVASRVSDLLDSINGGFIPNNEFCGQGTPSNERPSPWELANDPNFCEDKVNGNEACHYYSGGYDVQVHERMAWQDENNLSGDHFNAMQAELPRCIRFGGNTVRETFADKLSIAVMSFLRDLYGPMP